MASTTPWFAWNKPLKPLSVTVSSTAGLACRIPSTCAWYSCICAGDEPSCAMNTPRMNELSPTGKKALGTMSNR